MSALVEVRLERDGHDQPWGFRLQGGADVALPLSVQRVLVGTPAEGVLRKGDIIARISCTETKGITHQQAADLFNNAGNQISVYIKRAGVQVPASVPVQNGVPSNTQLTPPVSGGVALHGLTSVTTSRGQDFKRRQGSAPPTVTAMSLQSQSSRVVPPVPNNPKVWKDLGVGSVQHLRMQDDHLTGVKEPTTVVSPAQLAKEKAHELLMGQKTQQSLSSVATQNISSRGLATRQYNSPLPLYSAEAVQECIQQQTTPLQPKGIFQTTVHPTPSIAPNKPQQVILTPSKEYNPQESAIWRALQETAAPVDPEKLASYSSLKEHDPIYSEVYAVPVLPKPGQRPVSRTNTSSHGCFSPVADFLPNNLRHDFEHRQEDMGHILSPSSTARMTGFSDGSLMNHQMTSDPVRIPMYEADHELEQDESPRRPGGRKTNAIGGRKRITQSHTFNKLMMEVLGE